MPAIFGPESGPLAVTGASGFIGSHVVSHLVSEGYTVRACVRDLDREDKLTHLKALAASHEGRLHLYGCDLFKAAEGAYDEAFDGCAAVFHVAADLGSDAAYGRLDAQRLYDGCMTTTKGVLRSCLKAGSVRRVVYTSSCAAVFGPGEGGKDCSGYEFTEDNWAGMGGVDTLESRWTITLPSGELRKLWSVEGQPYAKGKVDAEVYSYEFGASHGIDVVTCNPCHVLGPILTATQNTGWQRRIGLMLNGESGHEGRYNELWNIIDVRDIADAQLRMAVSENARNGSRYMLTARDQSGEMTVQQLIDNLRSLYPGRNIAGSYSPPPTPDRPHAKCSKAMRELGLQPRDALTTLRDTCDSLIAMGLVP